MSETEACDENLKFPDVKGYVMLLITHSQKKKNMSVTHSINTGNSRGPHRA